MELKQSFDQKGHAVVNVKFTKEEMNKYIQTSVEEFAKTLKLKGYRPGQVPVDVARRYLTNEDLSNNLTRKMIKKAIKGINADKDLITKFYYKMLSNCNPKYDFKKISDTEGELDVIFLLLPSVSKCSGYKNLKVKYEPIKFEDKLVDEELSRLQKQNGDLVNSDKPIKKGDSVNLKISLFINGQKRTDINTNTLDLVIGEQKTLLKEKENELIGKKVGDNGTISFETDDKYPEPLNNAKVEVKYEIVEVSKLDLPKLDDEFATVQQTYKDCKNLDELKKAITKSLKERIEENNNSIKLQAILDEIIKNSEFEVDMDWIKQEIIRIQTQRDRAQLEQQGITLEDYLKFNSLSLEDYNSRIFDYVYQPLIKRAVEEYIIEKEPTTFKKDIDEKQLCEYHKIKSIKDYADSIKHYYSQANNYSQEEIDAAVANAISSLYSDYISNKQIKEYLISNNK